MNSQITSQKSSTKHLTKKLN